jgi:uncharacterized protein YjbI with pentapeptide repeats
MYDGYAFIDTETSGQGRGSRVIEIAIIQTAMDGTRQKEYSSLVFGDGRTGSAQAVAVHHITNEMIRDAPTFQTVWERIKPLIHNRILVAHNAEFDQRMINDELERIGVPPLAKFICTLKLVRHLGLAYRRTEGREGLSGRLGDVVGRLGLQVAPNHRALADAEALLALFWRLKRDYPDQVDGFNGLKTFGSEVINDRKSKNYSHEVLRGIDLSLQHLCGSEFIRVLADRSNFYNSDISQCNFTQAFATETNFSESIGSHAIFRQSILSSSSFQCANLPYTEFLWADLRNVDFSGADLTGADFRWSYLEGATFEGAMLTDAKFYGAYLSNTNFLNAIINDNEILEIRPDYHFSNLDLSGKKYRYLKHHFVGLTSFTESDFSGANLSGLDMSSSDLTESNFANSNLTGTNFGSSLLCGVNFECANLTNADLNEANLTGAKIALQQLKSAQLNSTFIDEATLIQNQIEIADLNGFKPLSFWLDDDQIGRIINNSSDLSSPVITYLCANVSKNCDSWNLSKLDLADKSFMTSSFVDCNFSETNLTDSNMGATNCSNSIFPGAILASTDFSNSDLTNCNFDRASISNCDFSGSNLSGAFLRNQDLSGMHFVDADFSDADLSGVNFSDSDLSECSFQSAWIDGANFTGADLTNCDFSSAVLTNCNFQDSILTNTNFAGANLQNSNIDSADTRKAKLRFAIRS